MESCERGEMGGGVSGTFLYMTFVLDYMERRDSAEKDLVLYVSAGLVWILL